MRSWGSPRTPQAGDHSAKYNLVFPPLSGDKLTKRQVEEAKLASVPLDLSFSSETENQEDHSLSSSSSLPTVVEAGTMTQEHTFTSAASDVSPLSSSLPTVDAAGTETQDHNLVTGLQAGSIKKDWSPDDDAETCPHLVYQQDRVISRPRRRLECFTKNFVDGKLTEEETTVAQKPDLSSGKGTMSATKAEESPRGDQKNLAGSTTTPQSETGTATASNGSSSVDGKLPKPETTVAQKPDSSTKQNPAGSTTPLSENRDSSCETLSLALFPFLTGAMQSKKKRRNSHLEPRQHE